ncbi:hypothetical protein [Corynebacterium sp. H113]|uniref:hypothetical protein n=1 Tax=Corynebacterium sp. H113 TaxID=3133419 RepID=UPI0030AE332B
MWLLDNATVYEDGQPLTAGWTIEGRGQAFRISAPDVDYVARPDGFLATKMTVSGPADSVRIKRQGRSWFVLYDDHMIAKYSKSRFVVFEESDQALPAQDLLVAAALVCWKMEHPDVYI